MSGEAPSAALPTGHRIGEYEIVRVLGAGGFGITYLAFDHQLDGPVAIKEYFPADLATRGDGWTVSAAASTSGNVFAWGLDRFLGEARAIHRFRHPNVVRAQRYLEANGTAYIVMEYVEGESLKAILDQRGSLSAEEWRPWMDALLDGLAHVHAHDYLHRDIKPANIVIRSEDGAPVLIDFGSARLQDGDRTLTQVLTAGYAPIEQYTNDAAQGPPGDIYALAAVAYRVLTGSAVASAPDRVLNDQCLPLAEQINDADSRWLAAIDHGLAVRPQDRPQSVAYWRQALDSAGVASPNTASAGSHLRRSNEEKPANVAPALPSADEALCVLEKPPPKEQFRPLWWDLLALLLALLVLAAIQRIATGPIGDSSTAGSVQTSRSLSSRTEVAGTAQATSPYFTLGSHQNDVLRIQGAPNRIDRHKALGYESWSYGPSGRVRISTRTRRVISWFNPHGQLRVRPRPGSNTTSARSTVNRASTPRSPTPVVQPSRSIDRESVSGLRTPTGSQPPRPRTTSRPRHGSLSGPPPSSSSSRDPTPPRRTASARSAPNRVPTPRGPASVARREEPPKQSVDRTAARSSSQEDGSAARLSTSDSVTRIGHVVSSGAEAPRFVSGDVTKPVKIHEVKPRYTDIARKARIEGVVVLQATIDQNGDVTDVKVLKGLRMDLNEAALRAAGQWKFKPATLHGRPVAVYYNLAFNFRLQ